MSITSQQYANLSKDSYEPRKKDDEITRDGVKYKVLEHVGNKISGYQGTIYQRIDTGEIVVAHRGTEFDQGLKASLQDGALADGGMVLARTNAQAKDAIQLTQRAIQLSEKNEKGYSPTPQVTVTGHSLGGCLAEITAYTFNLKGETFNAYGAVGLDQDVSEGGNNLINHVMAADPVSAASKHFGQMRVYATPEEMHELRATGYHNNGSTLQLRSLGGAVALSLDSHNMDNFLNVDAHGKPDKSVLADPHTRQLAAQFDPAIDRYRSDIALARGIVTFVARDPLGRIQDGIDAMRDPQPPSELLRRVQRQNSALSWEESRGIADANRLLPSRESPYHPEVTRPGGRVSLPDYLPQSDEQHRPPLKNDETPPYRGMPLSGITPGHPDYALYAELKQALPGEVSEDRLAQITVAAKMGGVRAGQLDGIHIDEQSMQAFVSGKVPGNRCCVDLTTPPPTAQETLYCSEVFDQQQAQQLAQFQAHQQSINAQAKNGAGFSLG